ncbi:MAG: ABC transporter, permease protein (cluster 3, basic aa/glutamine/opines), partial [uncultured Frankineae bacterium]
EHPRAVRRAGTPRPSTRAGEQRRRGARAARAGLPGGAPAGRQRPVRGRPLPALPRGAAALRAPARGPDQHPQGGGVRPGAGHGARGGARLRPPVAPGLDPGAGGRRDRVLPRRAAAAAHPGDLPGVPAGVPHRAVRAAGARARADALQRRGHRRDHPRRGPVHPEGAERGLLGDRPEPQPDAAAGAPAAGRARDAPGADQPARRAAQGHLARLHHRLPGAAAHRRAAGAGARQPAADVPVRRAHLHRHQPVPVPAGQLRRGTAAADDGRRGAERDAGRVRRGRRL